MPRFYFNIASEQPDKDGVELRDRSCARSEAIRAAGEILRDIDGRLACDGWMMNVSDEWGDVVLEVRFCVTERRT